LQLDLTDEETFALLNLLTDHRKRSLSALAAHPDAARHLGQVRADGSGAATTRAPTDTGGARSEASAPPGTEAPQLKSAHLLTTALPPQGNMPGHALPNNAPPRCRDGGARRHHDVVPGTSLTIAAANLRRSTRTRSWMQGCGWRVGLGGQTRPSEEPGSPGSFFLLVPRTISALLRVIGLFLTMPFSRAHSWYRLNPTGRHRPVG
jgi:hypothetical protein